MRSRFVLSRRAAPPRRRLRRTRAGLTLARWRRSGFVPLAVALSAAGASGMTASRWLGDAEAARDRWGDLVTVEVVTRDLGPGEVVVDGDVRTERRPRRLVPPASVRAPSAVGRVVVAPLLRGEVLTGVRVADDLLPPGWRAVEIPPPASGKHPRAAVGDVVDVLDVGGIEPSPPAEGVVVAVGEGSVTVAVAAADVGRVAYAAASASAVLALTAAPRPG
ncbi:MAG TPA: SAF domain-containing protein [Acidimicrobiales bacterium]|nr:SAF domain-containing protein [Acidimicrobiales bacterium]